MFRRMGILLNIPVFIVLAACSQVQSLTYGEPNFNTRVLLAQLGSNSVATPVAGAQWGSREAAEGLQPQSLPVDCTFAPRTTPTTDQVKACVYALKGLIDDQYREYRITLHHFVDDGNALGDTAVLGVNAAGAVIGGATTKAILHVVSGGIAGTKSIINEDVLYKQAITAVLNQMDADRDKQFSVMLNEMNGGNYTIGQAKDDLLVYFAAGTFDHGLSSLQAAAAANKANCQAQRDNTKVATSGGAASATTPAATTATPTGCPDTTTNNAAPGVSLSLPPKVTVDAAGYLEVALTVNSITDNKITISLNNVDVQNVAQAIVLGKVQGPTISVDLSKTSSFANGHDVVFFLFNIKKSTTPNILISIHGDGGSVEPLSPVAIPARYAGA